MGGAEKSFSPRPEPAFGSHASHNLFQYLLSSYLTFKTVLKYVIVPCLLFNIILGQRQEVFYFSGFWAHTPIQRVPQVKRAERYIDHCPPPQSGTEVTNEWGCASTTLIAIMVSPGIIYCCEHGVWSKRVKEKFSFLLCRLYCAVYLMTLPENGHSLCQSGRP